MILNLCTLNTDDQMLFPNFPFGAHNKVILVCYFAENKLNVATKKHSFIIDEALIDAEDRQDDGGYYQRSSFSTTLATSSSYRSSSSSYGCAAQNDIKAMKESLDVLLILRCQLLVRLNAAFCLQNGASQSQS